MSKNGVLTMENKKIELNDDLLDQVVGGAINVFDALSPK